MKKVLYNDDIEQLLRLSAHPLGDNLKFGAGLVDPKAAIDLLQYPHVLQHLTASGNSAAFRQTDWINQWNWVPPNGDGSQYYRVRRWEVYQSVTFPTPFVSVPYVWGRGAATVGYPSYTQESWNMGWCEAFPGSITTTGCTLRTFVYEVVNIGTGQQFWWPAHYNDVQFAYTALGTKLPTDNQDTQTSVSSLSLTTENPLHAGATLRLGVPERSKVTVELFDVAGRRIRILENAELSAGWHALTWDAHDDRGKKLPAGIYFARVRTHSDVLTRKIVVVE